MHGVMDSMSHVWCPRKPLLVVFALGVQSVSLGSDTDRIDFPRGAYAQGLGWGREPRPQPLATGSTTTMPRVSQLIRDAALDGRWDETAQRAAIWADMAPLLLDACSDVYHAIKQRRQPWGPKQLDAAHALCGQVIRAVYKATGMEPGSGVALLSVMGMPFAQQQAAALAAEKAVGRLDPDQRDDAVAYHARA